MHTPFVPQIRSRRIPKSWFKALAVILYVVLFLPPAWAEPAPARAAPTQGAVTPDPKKALERCVQKNEPLRELENSRLITARITHSGNFLALGTILDIGIAKKYEAGHRYHMAIVKAGDTKVRHVVNAHGIVSRTATDADEMVRNRSLSKGETILQARLPDDFRLTWQHASLYVYRCDTNPKKPEGDYIPVDIMRGDVIPSSRVASIVIFLAAICLAYLAARKLAGGSLLDLVTTDGKASLAKFQVLFFTFTVFGLLTYIFLRNGVLSGLSDTVLGLLGIAGVGSTLSRGMDSRSPSALRTNQWLVARALPPEPARPHWHDLFSTAGEFDIFKYQSLLFSLLVAIYLIAVGVTQLATFEIHNSLLTMLGLSQVVYLGGKVAAQSTANEITKAIEQGKNLEDSLRVAVVQANPQFNGPVSSAQEVAPLAYAQYEAQLREISAATGLNLTATLSTRKL